MLKKVEGFIVSDVDYKESSKILNVFTKEHGLIGIIAKGAKSPKSKFRSSVMKLTYGVFHIYYKEDKISTLTEVDIINPLKNIKKDLTLISYLSYITDLTHQVLKENKSSIDIYDLFLNTVLKLEEGFDPLVLTNILEFQYLKFLGVEPDLNCCSVCLENEALNYLDASYGGLVCDNCKNCSYITDEKTIKLLKIYKIIDIKKIEKLNIANKDKLELNAFLNNYYEKYTGLYLKSKSFLESILKL